MAINKKIYALVGNFGFHPGPKGISVYRYDPETAGMELIETVFDDVNVGHQTVDAERNIVYITNECQNLRGQLGGGGYVLALTIDPESGKLRLINEKPSLSGEPCYTCLDKTKRYLIVSHHADSGFATKIVKREAGFSSETVFDDTGLVLFRINEDGSLGNVCDVALTPGEGAAGPHTISHQHSVIADPTGELFVVPDKGLDQIHTFRLDRANGKLVHLADITADTGMCPRYGVFHPTLPIFYTNFERKTVVCAYRYDIATGKLDQIASTPLLMDEKVVEGAVAGAATSRGKVEASDILIHPNGKFLYSSVRGTDTIAVLDVDHEAATEGAISLRENIDCGGVNPRGLYISPDTRFLFAANMDSGDITTFAIEVDGSLCPTGTAIKGRCPGTMRIIAA